MSDSSCIDSPCKEGAMPKSYSSDLRKRVIGAVEAGASRRDCAEHSGEMAAMLERDWKLRAEAARRKRFASGSSFRADIGFDHRSAGPDFERNGWGTAQAANSHQQERGPAVSRATRHDLQKKRVCGPPNSSARTSPGRGGAGSGSKACLIPPDWYSSTRLQSLPTWCGFGDGVREASN